MEKLTINHIASVLVEKYGIAPKDAEQFVAAMFDVIQDGVENDKQVKVRGLGTFKLVDVEPRESVNVNTGERVLIKGHSKISFIPDTSMKEMEKKRTKVREQISRKDAKLSLIKRRWERNYRK